MTEAATQITLCIAERVRVWCGQERDLAIAIRSLHALTGPPPAPAVVAPGHLAHFVPAPSPLVVEVPTNWSKPDPGNVPVLWNDCPPTKFAPIDDSFAPSAPAHLWPELGSDSTSPFPNEPAVPGRPRAPSGPFDEFIAALTDAPIGPPPPMRPLPPPSRFMVRVAPLGRPHRATKRDYDYFEELNAKLAAQASAQLGSH